MPIPQKPFYMMRHGETEANAARVMAGSTDSPLTAKGINQAHEAKKVVSMLETLPVAVFHSHLSRARDTATIVNEAIGKPIFEDPNLAEIHAGDLEGQTYDKCESLFRAWPRVLNGEEPNEFFDRVKLGKSTAIEKFNDPVLIVCHGGVMRAFAALYGLTVPGRFENAHLYEFIPTPQKSQFPWTVYDYKWDEETQTVIKTASDIYESESSALIA